MYDFKKTLMKGAEIFVFGGLGAIIAELGSLPQTETIIVATILLKMLENYIKNRDV
jgi:hypothetical protein